MNKLKTCKQCGVLTAELHPYAVDDVKERKYCLGCFTEQYL